MRISLYLFIFTYFLACSVVPVSTIKLTSDETGYDVACQDNGAECKTYAKSLCSGSYRIHSLYTTDYTIMRFQCLETAEATSVCSETGVSCVL